MENDNEMYERVVGYSEYRRAMSEFRRKMMDIGMDTMHGIDFVDTNTKLDGQILIGVNWAAVGTVTPDSAMAFAERIQKAAAYADSFMYNGYRINYQEEEPKKEIPKWMDPKVGISLLTIGEADKRREWMHEMKEERNRGNLDREAYDILASLFLG